MDVVREVTVRSWHIAASGVHVVDGCDVGRTTSCNGLGMVVGQCRGKGSRD